MLSMYCVSIRFYLDTVLRQRDSYPSIVRLFPTISSISVGDIRKLLVKIPTMNTILMGYWLAGQVGIIMSGVMHKSKFRMGDMILSRVLMIPYEIFFREHLRNTRRIYMLGSGRGRVDGLGDAL